MSNIYVHEPPTEGKVLLKTTVGEIEVELWSKEAPKACRNFVQLCMEGYYNGTIFHRLVKDFIVQGGDPMGDGSSTGESIYGKPFNDEFHSRLRFVRRGLVAMANSGRNDNTSHFFFTLAACSELNNKNTIFGRVGGDTIYNMLRLAEAETDSNDRPLFPQKINKTKIISNPFDDIIPREIKKTEETETAAKPKVHSKSVKNFGLLSFGDEAREDEEEVIKASEKFQNKSKSSHDLLNDKNLSSVPAIQIDEDDDEVVGSGMTVDSVRDKLKRKRNDDAMKAKKSKADGEGGDEGRPDVFVEMELKLNNSSAERIKKYKEEAKKLLKDLRKNVSGDTKVDGKANPENRSKLTRNLGQFESRRANLIKKNPKRESEVLERLSNLRQKLDSANRLTEYGSGDEEGEEEEDGGEEDDATTNRDISWMTAELKSVVNNAKVLDANIADVERYEISDPRNPMAQRRRKDTDVKSKPK